MRCRREWQREEYHPWQEKRVTRLEMPHGNCLAMNKHSFRPTKHHGFMPRKSIYNGRTPCTLFPEVSPKGIIFPDTSCLKGSRGAGSHCQLNRGINPCAWIGQGLASSANNARLAAKTSGMIRLSSRVKIVARRACFGFFGCCGYCWEW